MTFKKSNIEYEIQQRYSVKDFETFSFNEIEKEENEKSNPTPLPKKCELSTVIDLRDDIDKSIKNRLEDTKNPNQQLNLKEEINRNVTTLKEFRKTGIINQNQIKNNNTLIQNPIPKIQHHNNNNKDIQDNIPENKNLNSTKRSSKSNEKIKNSITELEKRR